MVADVADHADHVLGYQPADGPAGVHADHHPTGRVEHEPGGLQEHWLGVDERPGGLCDRSGVGAVADREGQAEFGHQLTVVVSSSTDKATTRASTSARLSAARWNARSWALQYGHQAPR